MMKQKNLFLKTALAMALGCAGAAHAATAISTTAVSYAAEQFAGTTPSAAVVSPTINVVAGTAIPAGSVVTVMVQLTGGIFGVTQTGNTTANTAANVIDAPTAMPLAAPTCTMGSTIAGTTTAAAGVTGTPTATASNADVVSCQFTTVNAVGIGGTLLRLATPSISAAGLATTTNTVAANATILVGTIAAPVGAAVPTTGTLEGASGPVNFATSAKGITISAAANTSVGKIDLTAATPSTKFTVAGAASAIETNSTTTYKLGTITIMDGAAKLVTVGNGAYATGAKTSVVTVAAPAGFFAPMGTTGVVTVNAGGGNACAGALVVTSATFGTAALAAAATSVSLPATNLTATTTPGTTRDVCYTVNGTTVIPAGTPTVAVTLGTAAAQDSADTLAATNLEALALNGAQYDVRNYVPAAAAGYGTFVRVINTGSVAAPVSVALIPDGTGVVGTAGVAITSLAPGAAVNLTPTQIEAVTGAVAAASRPRLRITAPTNGLQVQTFLAQPNGTISDMTGAQ